LKVGLITIGQSPRTDVTSTLREVLGPQFTFLERGALDGLSEKEVDALAPKERDTLLVTRLRNGKSVKVAQRHILPKIQEQIHDLETSVDVVVLLCTGKFPMLTSRKLLILPDLLLSSVVWSILRRGRLGIVVPDNKQRDMAKKKWARKTITLCVEVANPYDQTHISEAAESLTKKNVDLIVLDCIGFTPELKRKFQRKTMKPIILPQTVIARVIEELASIHDSCS